MYQVDDPRPSLPDWILDAYDVLHDHIEETGDVEEGDILAIQRERAVDALLATDEMDLSNEDVEYALTRLLKRGYIYEVHGELRIPPD